MKQTVSRPSSLRFRRWSRKAYAAFASIGRHVTIGCVSKSIADKSLTKQASAKAVIPYSKDGREPKRGEDCPVGNRGSTAGLYPVLSERTFFLRGLFFYVHSEPVCGAFTRIPVRDKQEFSGLCPQELKEVRRSYRFAWGS